METRYVYLVDLMSGPDISDLLLILHQEMCPMDVFGLKTSQMFVTLLVYFKVRFQIFP